LLIIVGIKASIIFWQFNFYHFLVPPSPDLVAHLKMTDQFIAGNWTLTGYPPLLHTLTALAANYFHTDSLAIYNVIAPYWLIIPIFTFYILVNVMFEYKTAFWATLVFALVSTSPLLSFADAEYADILGYCIIGPLYLASFFWLMKDYRWWKLIIPLVLFGLLLSAHQLSAMLVYLVTLASLAVNLIVNHRADKLERKKTMIVLACFLFGTFLFYILAKIFFGSLLSNTFTSIFQFKRPISDITGDVFQYSELSFPLAPFLEFVGFAGIAISLVVYKEDKQRRFPIVAMIVWVLLVWLMSRSSLSVLPQRIFREVSLPLSIAAGFFAVTIFQLLHNNYQKYLMALIFGYLIVINSSQLFLNPFMLPDGFKNMVWYRENDQEKYDYINTNLNKDNKILVNSFNPVLVYKLQKAGFGLDQFVSLEPPNLKDKKLKTSTINDSVNNSGSTYLLLGVAPDGVNTDVYFTSFVNYTKATEYLSNYEYDKSNLIKQFSDGSKLIKIEKPEVIKIPDKSKTKK